MKMINNAKKQDNVTSNTRGGGKQLIRNDFEMTQILKLGGKKVKKYVNIIVIKS